MMFAGALALLAGMGTGLARLGWQLPGAGERAADHGALMVCGFLGTLIGMERAAALGRSWGFAGPLLSGLGVLAVVLRLPQWVSPLAMTAAGLCLLAMSAAVIAAQPALFTATMGAGAIAWLGGNLAWLAGRPGYEVASWWIAFLLLTIAGERLEMTRFTRPSAASQRLFACVLVALAAGLLAGGFGSPVGSWILGLALVGLAGWLAQYDVARRTVAQAGLTRFTAMCLLTGYAWLGIGGVMAMLAGPVYGGFRYDAIVHAVLLGFVFAMIFGHAPIIMPAVLRVPVSFRRRFYVHLILLHASLALRLIGDVAELGGVRAWGGLLNVTAVLVFLGNTAAAVRAGSKAAQQAGAPLPPLTAAAVPVERNR